MKTEILFNSKLNDYTLQAEVDGVKSIKKIPLKFKAEDTTARFRQKTLKEKVLKE